MLFTPILNCSKVARVIRLTKQVKSETVRTASIWSGEPPAVSTIATLRAENEAAKAENEAAKAEIEALKAANEAANVEIGALKAENDALKGRTAPESQF